MVLVESEDGTSSNVQVCSILDDYDCPRVVFGQYLGLVCGVISLLMIFITRLSVVFNIIVGTLMLLSYGFGVTYISSSGGHGVSANGSVYLEIWACVFLALDVATTNIAILVRRKRDDDDDDVKDDDDENNDGPLINHHQLEPLLLKKKKCFLIIYHKYPTMVMIHWQ